MQSIEKASKATSNQKYFVNGRQAAFNHVGSHLHAVTQNTHQTFDSESSTELAANHFIVAVPNVSSLYQSHIFVWNSTQCELTCRCIRTVCRDIDFYNRHFDLTQLPWNIKTDLIHLNMKLKGFRNEEPFMRLLTSHVKTLIFDTTNLNDAMLLRIAQQCQLLQELIIVSSESHFSRLGLCNSIRSLQNLKVLQIVGKMEINGTVLAVISANCRKLKSLWINDCPNVNDTCTESLKTMPLLELNVANTKVSDRFCILLGNWGRHRKGVTSLISSHQITDAFLQTAKNSVLMEHLRDICLRNCAITQNGLVHLNWSRLENINIVGAAIEGNRESQPLRNIRRLTSVFLQIYRLFHRMPSTKPLTGLFEQRV